MPAPKETDTQTWRILLFAHEGSELLLFQKPAGLGLPRLRIPRWQRVAPNLNAETKRLWNLETVCLFPFEVPGSGAAPLEKYHVMELVDPVGLARRVPGALEIAGLRDDSFADPQDLVAVRQTMAGGKASLPAECRGPFASFGSFRKVFTWVRDRLECEGLRFDGRFHQLQAGASFALIRFPTDRGAAWFKAVGEPLTREFRLTQEIAARFPLHLPTPIATCAEWNGWLMRESEGQDLASGEVHDWERAARSLADLQIASVGHRRAILAAGAHDVRTDRLLELAPAFFEVMTGVMARQGKPTPPPLGARTIREVREQVVRVLEKLAGAGLPDSLNHLDLNPGNVIVEGEKITFLDWAEAAVGNPFFSLEYLRQHFRRMLPGHADREAGLIRSYLSRWPGLTGREADRVAAMAPLAALFAYAVSVLPWKQPGLEDRPDLCGFLRSLVRRMNSECQQLTAGAGEVRAGT